MGVTPDGKVTTVKKAGPGAFNMDSLQTAVQDGKDIGVQVQKVLMEKILMIYSYLKNNPLQDQFFIFFCFLHLFPIFFS